MSFEQDFPDAVPVTALGVRTITGYDAGNRPIYATRDEPVGKWVLWPTSSNENVVQQDIVTDRLEGFAPPNVDLASVTKVKVAGFPNTYNIVGTPWSWHDPFTGDTPGQTVALQRVM